MVRAALDGVGLALAFEGHVAALIAERRLVRVLEDWCPAFPGFYLYYPSRRQVPAGLRAFIEMSSFRRQRSANE
jgi:DNA-binding transcriptional LysR family regulator